MSIQSFPNSEVALGRLVVRRALPVRNKRMIGAWCFLDRFGPLSFGDEKPMDVAPHPHIGLQTVTWLLEGEILHDDSLRCEAVARPGGVNVMTAGNGISHAEQTPKEHSSKLNGVQLWTALPEARRHGAAQFEAIGEVPRVEQAGGIVSVFAGELGGARCEAEYFSEIVGAEVEVHAGCQVELDLRADFEYGVLLLEGAAWLEGELLLDKQLYYLEAGGTGVQLSSNAGAKVLLIGGPPFPEKIVMWWNFVGRTAEEIAVARADWEAFRRFGDVHGYVGPRLAAPPLVKIAGQRVDQAY